MRTTAAGVHYDSPPLLRVRGEADPWRASATLGISDSSDRNTRRVTMLEYAYCRGSRTLPLVVTSICCAYFLRFRDLFISGVE
jgi:hypothetical protein